MTVVPDTAQSCVSARNETGSPELAVATRVTAAPVPAPAGWANVIFCATFPAVTWKDCSACGAAVYRALPPWEAMIVHTPAASAVAVVPETVHTGRLPERKATGRPEDAVAISGTRDPARAAGGALKSITCGCAPAWISSERATSGAEPNAALPPCEAVMVHIPAARAVSVVPETVHTERVSERSDTGSCEVARANSTTGLPATVPGGCLNLMVCGLVPAWTVKERARPAAGA